MPLIRTYMYNHKKKKKKIAFERATVVHMKQCFWVGLIWMSPFKGLLTCAGNNAFGWDLHVQFWMSPLKGLLLYARNNASR